jgi:hypothetical protein
MVEIALSVTFPAGAILADQEPGFNGAWHVTFVCPTIIRSRIAFHLRF